MGEQGGDLAYDEVFEGNKRGEVGKWSEVMDKRKKGRWTRRGEAFRGWRDGAYFVD